MRVNLVNFKKTRIILSVFLFFILFFGQNVLQSLNSKVFNIEPVLAAGDCKVSISLILRNQTGEFVPELDYAIYTQVFDADGELKPGVQKVSGKTNINTGIGQSTFKYNSNDNRIFLIKVWDINSSVGAMYFYDSFEVASCPIEGSDVISSQDVEENISGLNLVFRDSQGDLKTDVKFKIYSQKYDVDNNPVKDQKLGSFTMGTSGNDLIYFTDKTRSIDGEFNGNYVLEATGTQGGAFLKYNIKIDAEKTTDVTYKFSDIAFTVKDAEGVLFPSGSEIKIYEQKTDLDGEKIFGSLLKKIKTNDKGVAILEYPEGTYAASIVGGDGQIYRYYDLKMVDQTRKEIILKTTDTYIPDGDICSEKSFLDVVTRSSDGNIIPNLKVALYKQLINANDVPIKGSLLVKGKTADTGIAHLSFNPDPRATYILNIYDYTDKAGEFWFFDDIQFYCGEDKEISKNLSSIKVIIRNSDGNIMPGQKFSIYAQKYDIDGNPIKEKSTLVKTLNLGGEGYSNIYVAGDHPYDSLKKGIYAFYLKFKKEYLEYNINVKDEKETVFEFTMPTIDDTNVNDNTDNNNDTNDDGYKPPVKNGSLTQRLQGYILLQVEDHGEAWYVDNTSQQRFYMKDGPVAYEMLRKFGLGITNADLEKIAIGLDSRLEEVDSDKDGLPDKMEEALGSGVYNSDSDNDGFLDGDEVKAGYSPISSDTTKIHIDTNLTNKLLGRIMLQVESRGEAWYLNPQDGKRYYMKDGDSAYQLMRFLSLGITNQDLNQIPAGTI